MNKKIISKWTRNLLHFFWLIFHFEGRYSIMFVLLFFSFGIKPLNHFIYQFTLKKISSRNFVCIITCCRGVNCSSKCALFRIINWIHVIRPFVWYYKNCSVPFYSVFHFVFNFRFFWCKNTIFIIFSLHTKKKQFTKLYQGSSLLAIIVNIIMANWFSCFFSLVINRMVGLSNIYSTKRNVSYYINSICTNKRKQTFL